MSDTTAATPGSVDFDHDAVRRQQRQEWAACAPGWLVHRDAFVGPSRPFTEAMLGLADVRPGQRILDLACGNGNPTFDLARLVGPGGEVLGLDLTAEMVESARRIAADRKVTNAEFRTIPDELHLGVEPGTFDGATCRAGLQYFPDRTGAARAVLDALRPGGRFVVMTIGAPERCVPFKLTNRIVARHIELPQLTTETPGPVGLSTIEQLEEVLGDAGFTDIRTTAVTAPIYEAPDPGSAWRVFTETAGPFMALLESLTPEQRAAMDADAERIFAEEFPSGPVRPTGEALIACGVKPS